MAPILALQAGVLLLSAIGAWADRVLTACAYFAAEFCPRCCVSGLGYRGSAAGEFAGDQGTPPLKRALMRDVFKNLLQELGKGKSLS
jgi:hypothetical protein